MKSLNVYLHDDTCRNFYSKDGIIEAIISDGVLKVVQRDITYGFPLSFMRYYVAT